MIRASFCLERAAIIRSGSYRSRPEESIQTLSQIVGYRISYIGRSDERPGWCSGFRSSWTTYKRNNEYFAVEEIE